MNDTVKTETPLAQSAVVMLTQEELGCLLSAAMCADPLPVATKVPLNRFLDRVSQQFGAHDWIDAFHRIKAG